MRQRVFRTNNDKGQGSIMYQYNPVRLENDN